MKKTILILSTLGFLYTEYKKYKIVKNIHIENRKLLNENRKLLNNYNFLDLKINNLFEQGFKKTKQIKKEIEKVILKNS